MKQKFVLLGVGQTATALNRLLQKNIDNEIWGTTRSADSFDKLAAVGINPIVLDIENIDFSLLQEACRQANVLVSFPPDGRADAVLSKLVFAASPRKVVYISSTGVYGKLQGKIDESSPVDVDERSKARLQAEAVWKGAVILRAPGLYNAESGLHLRLLSGSYRLPGDGSNFVSRIHLDDLARIIIAAFDGPELTYVVGDLRPATHLETVSWLCEKLSLPLPQSVPLSEVHYTLQGSRQITARKILDDLSIDLLYPSYVEGFSQCLNAMKFDACGNETGIQK